MVAHLDSQRGEVEALETQVAALHLEAGTLQENTDCAAEALEKVRGSLALDRAEEGTRAEEARELAELRSCKDTFALSQEHLGEERTRAAAHLHEMQERMQEMQARMARSSPDNKACKTPDTEKVGGRTQKKLEWSPEGAECCCVDLRDRFRVGWLNGFSFIFLLLYNSQT